MMQKWDLSKMVAFKKMCFIWQSKTAALEGLHLILNNLCKSDMKAMKNSSCESARRKQHQGFWRTFFLANKYFILITQS